MENHRIIDVGKDLLKSPCPNPLLKSGQLEQVAQDHVQWGFKYLHRWRFHSISGNSFLHLTIVSVTKYFLALRWNFMGFNLCLLPLVLSVGTATKSLAPLSSLFPIRYLYTLPQACSAACCCSYRSAGAGSWFS